jgi:hypothetical protein
MTEKGITETSEFVRFVCALANTVANVLEDGKVKLLELPQLMMLLPKLLPAVQGANEIPGELADLTEEEIKELVELVKVELNLKNDAENLAAQFVLATFVLIKAIHQLVRLTKKDKEDTTV